MVFKMVPEGKTLHFYFMPKGAILKIKCKKPVLFIIC